MLDLLLVLLLAQIPQGTTDTKPNSGIPQSPPKINLADWTPPPLDGNVEPWQKAIETNWIDNRFQKMDTGPFLNATFHVDDRVLLPGALPIGVRTQIGPQTVFKGTAFKLDPEGKSGVIYDRNLCRCVAFWTGGFLQHSDKRFGLLNTPRPAGQVITLSKPMPGFADQTGKFPVIADGTFPLPEEHVSFQSILRNKVQFVTSDGFLVAENPQIFRPLPDVVGLNRRLLIHASRTTISEGTDPLKVGILAVSLPSTQVHPKRINDIEFVTHPLPNGEVLGVATRRVKTPHETPPTNTQLQIDQAGNCSLRLEVKRPAELTTAVEKEEKHDETIVHVEIDLLVWVSRVERTEQVLNAFRTLPKVDADKPSSEKSTREIVAENTIITQGKLGSSETPFAIDTLTVPYQNKWNALFFITGVDFLSDGRVAVCTAHGDVWIVTPGADLSEIKWQRVSTGLYQPMGIYAVRSAPTDDLYVLERGQLTRLRLVRSGRFEEYASVAGNWHHGGGEHSYDTCLEVDPKTNDFYFFKTGDTHLPTGGCLMKIGLTNSKVKDRLSLPRASASIFATGFRHPIGMGMSPTGMLTGGDQQGNWMPATRLDVYQKGGFYGDMRAHHRAQAPTDYDPVLMWLPHSSDNSAGGQIWIPKGSFGELSERCIHLSWGRCKGMLLSPHQTKDGHWQAGAVDLPSMNFLSGSKTGRFNPKDGHLYVVGLNGWQTSAKADGCLQRVRYNGNLPTTPIGFKVAGNTIDVTFTKPILKETVNLTNVVVSGWDYWWSEKYGSDRYLPGQIKAGKPIVPPGLLQKGQAILATQSVELLPDGKTLRLTFPQKVQPIMQLEIAYRLADQTGLASTNRFYLTVNGESK